MIELSELKIGMEVEAVNALGEWLPGVIRKIETHLPGPPVVWVDTTWPDGAFALVVRTLDELRKVGAKVGER